MKLTGKLANISTHSPDNVGYKNGGFENARSDSRRHSDTSDPS